MEATCLTAIVSYTISSFDVPIISHSFRPIEARGLFALLTTVNISLPSRTPTTPIPALSAKRNSFRIIRRGAGEDGYILADKVI